MNPTPNSERQIIIIRRVITVLLLVVLALIVAAYIYFGMYQARQVAETPAVPETPSANKVVAPTSTPMADELSREEKFRIMNIPQPEITSGDEPVSTEPTATLTAEDKAAIMKISTPTEVEPNAPSETEKRAIMEKMAVQPEVTE